MKLSKSLVTLVVLASIQGCGGGGDGGGDHDATASLGKNHTEQKTPEQNPTQNQDNPEDSAAISIGGIPGSYWTVNGMTYFQDRNEKRKHVDHIWKSASPSDQNKNEFKYSEIAINAHNYGGWDILYSGDSRTTTPSGEVYLKLKKKPNDEVYADYIGSSPLIKHKEEKDIESSERSEGKYIYQTIKPFIAKIRNPSMKDQGFPDEIKIEVKNLVEPFCYLRTNTVMAEICL
ncbi:MAG: hypothetical protein Q4B17_14475 [Lautropia sp.]|nr:hypothetical protein [Lautropia sp.]